MKRFNFILAYSDPNSFISSEDLYIKPSKNFDQIKSAPTISAFGFSIGKRENRSTIIAIEENSIADIAGLKPKDILLGVDNGAFDLNKETVFNSDLIAYLADKKTVLLQVEREEKVLELQLER
jgi:C-terminal processing protease CtpA/Prc